MGRIAIVGYEQDTSCDHCKRKLVHGIRLSDGRVVGATCLDQKLTMPKVCQGKKYRLGTDLIIKAAKVVEWKPPSAWDSYGITANTIQFETVDIA